MKKAVKLLFALTLIVSMIGCGSNKEKADVKSEGVMTHAEYVAAALETEVVVETYVQAKQGWWEKDGVGVITLYTQDPDGAYFAYEVACSKEDADKLAAGPHVRIKGSKTVYNGLTEIMNGTLEILTDGTWIAEATDVTAMALAMDNNMPMVCFGLEEENSIIRVVRGEKIGTTVTN